MPAKPSRARDVRLCVSLRAKPAQAYKALTSARELCRWWLSGAETDARNGGRLRMVWPKRTGQRGLSGEREGVFVDLDPERKVAWLWKAKTGKGRVPPLCNFFILPKGRGCEVTLIHAGFGQSLEARQDYELFRADWQSALARLKRYLETGRPA